MVYTFTKITTTPFPDSSGLGVCFDLSAVTANPQEYLKQSTIQGLQGIAQIHFTIALIINDAPSP